MILQGGQLAADRGERQAQAPGTGRQAAGIGHRQEYPRRIEPIHGHSPDIWKDEYRYGLFIVV
ncbi:hypothetical protein STHU_50770 [Allostella humosa]|nr:hypothetical protein STHU_50770 [Stella humosa]